jgi:DNA invertase Pin-like site-specific DNA recombinase
MRYVGREGWEVLEEIERDEGVKGETPLADRPELVEAVQRMRRGDVLLVYKRDRLSRDHIDLALFEAMLRRKGCRLVSALGEGTELNPDDPLAVLIKGVVDLFSKFEVMMIRFRTRGALLAKRRKGERNGQTPYGWDLHDDGRRSKVKIDKRTGQVISGGKPIALVPNSAEQAALRAMARMQSEGCSLAAIADYLNRRSIYTKAGKPWARSSVSYVLKVSVPLLEAEPDGDEAEGQSTHPDHPGGPAPGGDPVDGPV